MMISITPSMYKDAEEIISIAKMIIDIDTDIDDITIDGAFKIFQFKDKYYYLHNGIDLSDDVDEFIYRLNNYLNLKLN